MTTIITICLGLWDDTIIETNEQERYALDIAKDALAVETVLLADEARFLPSYWFHDVIGLQKMIHAMSAVEYEELLPIQRLEANLM